METKHSTSHYSVALFHVPGGQVHVTIIPKKEEFPLFLSSMKADSVEYTKLMAIVNKIHVYLNPPLPNTTFDLLWLTKMYFTQTIFGPISPRTNSLIIIFKRISDVNRK